jgi:hypothetical protein
MKKILLFLFVLPTLSWSQEVFTGLIFEQDRGASQVLQLSKYRGVSGKLELRNIRGNSKTPVRISYGSQEVKDFSLKVLDSDLDKLSCDGDFFVTYDAYGTQYIQINSIRVCLDNDGWVVAHSFGIPPLKPEEIAASTRVIELSRAPAKADPAIYESHTPKVVSPNAGVFLGRKSEVQTQAK